MSDRAIKIVVAVVLLGIGAVVYFVFNPEDNDFFPPCFFNKFTGYDCPGCGTQRGLHNLLHLNVVKALWYNPIIVLAIPYLLVGVYMEYYGGKQRFPKFRKAMYGKRASIIIFAIIIVYWIGRNVVKAM